MPCSRWKKWHATYADIGRNTRVPQRKRPSPRTRGASPVLLGHHWWWLVIQVRGKPRLVSWTPSGTSWPSGVNGENVTTSSHQWGFEYSFRGQTPNRAFARLELGSCLAVADSPEARTRSKIYRSGYAGFRPQFVTGSWDRIAPATH